MQALSCNSISKLGHKTNSDTRNNDHLHQLLGKALSKQLWNCKSHNRFCKLTMILYFGFRKLRMDANFWKWEMSQENRGLPCNQKNEGNNPQNALIYLVFMCGWSWRLSRGSVSLSDPSKLGSNQEYKSEEKPWNKSSYMSKVVHMGEDSDC